MSRRRRNAAGTKRADKSVCLKTRHAGLDAEFFAARLAAMTMPSPRRRRDPHSRPAVFIERDFAARKKTVAIHVQNPVFKSADITLSSPPRHVELFTAAVTR